jgi:RNA polymerase sigma-70 factor, ECF subfamily
MLAMVPPEKEGSPPAEASRQESLYRQAAADFGAALDRLARGHEAQEDRRRDLLQEIHVALWRSFATFDERCSVRTWVYRVAQNVAVSHVMRDRRIPSKGMVSLAQLEALPAADDPEGAVDRRRALARLLELVQRLTPVDRQVILLYLEDFDTAAISEVTGLSTSNVGAKVHRIKSLLAHRFHAGERHA